VQFFTTVNAVVVKLVKFITTVDLAVAEVTVATIREIIFYCCCCHAVAVKFIVTIVAGKFVELYYHFFASLLIKLFYCFVKIVGTFYANFN